MRWLLEIENNFRVFLIIMLLFVLIIGFVFLFCLLYAVRVPNSVVYFYSVVVLCIKLLTIFTKYYFYTVFTHQTLQNGFPEQANYYAGECKRMESFCTKTGCTTHINYLDVTTLKKLLLQQHVLNKQ